MMADSEHEVYPDRAVVHTAMAGMCKRNGWRLLDINELARQVQALLIAKQGPQPEAPGRDTALPQPERPWRTRRAGVQGDSIEGAALHVYSETLYAAYADRTDEERQRQAYDELFRYLFRASYRWAPEFARDEREELAYHVMAELYFRLVASQDAMVSPGVRVTSAFLAIALQQMRNAIRQWRTVTRPWVTLTISEDQPTTANLTIDALPDTNGTYDPVLRIEREERQAHIRHLFTQAIERYPRARIQFHVVWLRLIEQLSYTTIAQRLQMTVENVRVLYCRGLKRLRNEPGFCALAEEEQLIPGHVPASAFEQRPEIQREHGQ